ncbi:MAG: c-type cytochrome [Phycisphaerae bacterium]
MRAPWAVLGLVVALVCGGCGRDEGDVDTSRPAEFGFQTNLQTSLVEEGRATYLQYCVGCHGPDGDGKGEAARFFHPTPRNFQKANFKFSSTRSGQLPTDADLRRTILNGLKGSAMPPFELLPARSVDGLIAYVKTFSPKWRERQPSSAIPRVHDPYRNDPAKGIARGEMIYHGYAQCWNCHPSYVSSEKLNQHRAAVGNNPLPSFRPNIDRSVGKPNTEGEIVYPPDFLRDFVRSGADVESLYRSVAAGITGTAMPTWVDSMEVPGDKEGDPPLVQPADLWATAYYVQDLIRRRPAKLAEGSFEVRDRTRKLYIYSEPPPPAPIAETETEPAEEFLEDDEDD